MKKLIYISAVVLVMLSCSNKNRVTPRYSVYDINDTTLLTFSDNGSLDVVDDMTIEDISVSKVGIAFGGGGAKAAAEIGVLKVIEEAGIKPGYIAGSSMGAVVGGLYAAGYSAKELDSLFLTEASHEPEHKLRSYMADWGLCAGTKSEGKKLFVQCQFYAGDSGSVSHKVVDQTDASRNHTLKFYPNAVFVEYLDGAGYFSSLNGDLKKMLAKKTTKAFIQVKTAPVKFRRELQEIDFLTPLEIEHAILAGNKAEAELVGYLQAQGYDKEEIYRSLDVCKAANLLDFNNDNYAI